jgi:DHA3 family multidrug efflux protein-like MFS transporter
VATFHRLLLNSLLSGVVATFLWFALTFWVYLATSSVVTTSVVGGAYALFSAVFGLVFGTYVDHHRKKAAMLLSTMLALGCYLLVGAVYLAVPTEELVRLSSPWLWVLIVVALAGTVAGNLRGIALGTCVTLLVPASERDKANGMVGSVLGVSFAITSVLSGLVIGQLGMGWAVLFTVGLTVVALVDLLAITVPEPRPAGHAGRRPRVDVRGTWAIVAGVPGLTGLILFAAFNNLLGGVFMALMDAYGLSIVSVEAWGVLWGFISLAFIAGGLVVARRGLGSRPIRVILVGNAINWTVCVLFPLRSSIVLLTVAMVIYLAMIPAIEAAEQTVLQRVVPFEQQGRVFGFAQTVENAASPLTSFLVGPLTQAAFIPFMTDGRGAELIGGWFGSGRERGIALVFCVAGVAGMAATAAARASGWYGRLSRR